MKESIGNTLIYPESLSKTLDAVSAALFEGHSVSDQERWQAAAWIADRQGLPGSYAGMFAPTEKDYAFGAETYTGEPVRSGAGTGHILSEEACRALFMLASPEPEVREALKRARQGILRRLEQSEVRGQWSGVFCCSTCSVALWRHLSASGEPDDQLRLEHGISELKRSRDGKGRWRRFPFFYTLLAFSGMPAALVKEEIVYALPVIDRALRRAIKLDPELETSTGRRRRLVMERVLENC